MPIVVARRGEYRRWCRNGASQKYDEGKRGFHVRASMIAARTLRQQLRSTH
jgi:hypothetical protein